MATELEIHHVKSSSDAVVLWLFCHFVRAQVHSSSGTALEKYPLLHRKQTGKHSFECGFTYHPTECFLTVDLKLEIAETKRQSLLSYSMWFFRIHKSVSFTAFLLVRTPKVNQESFSRYWLVCSHMVLRILFF